MLQFPMPRKDLRLMVKGLIAGIWTLSLAFVLLFAVLQHGSMYSLLVASHAGLSSYQPCMVTICRLMWGSGGCSLRSICGPIHCADGQRKSLQSVFAVFRARLLNPQQILSSFEALTWALVWALGKVGLGPWSFGPPPPPAGPWSLVLQSLVIWSSGPFAPWVVCFFPPCGFARPDL